MSIRDNLAFSTQLNSASFPEQHLEQIDNPLVHRIVRSVVQEKTADPRACDSALPAFGDFNAN